MSSFAAATSSGVGDPFFARTSCICSRLSNAAAKNITGVSGNSDSVEKAQFATGIRGLYISMSWGALVGYIKIWMLKLVQKQQLLRKMSLVVVVHG